MPLLMRKTACHSVVLISVLATGCNLLGLDSDGGGEETCTPTGAELCDGVDNDCDPTTEDGADEPDRGAPCDGADDDLCEDGVLACTGGALVCEFDDPQNEDCDSGVLPSPPVRERFPLEGRAAAAADVAFTFDFGVTDATAECRTGFPGNVTNMPWQTCASLVDGTETKTVIPHTETESTDPAFDGPTETHIRFITPEGARTQPHVARYYVHSSLHGVTRCQLERPVEDYFEAARPLLSAGGGGAVIRSRDVHLANPFVQIRFFPPVESTFEVADGDGEVDVMSLRRVFTLNEGAGDMLMIYRSYASRRGRDTCRTATIRKRGPGGTSSLRNINHYNHCEVLVFNNRGAGVCLQGTSTQVNVVYEGDRRFHPLADFFGVGVPEEYTCGERCADNFMWRKIQRLRRGQLRYFSPKCAVASQCASDEVFVPGRNAFPVIFR